jgi:hypothetical protein
MKTKILILTGLLCFISSAVSAQDVYVNSSPGANFAQYHNYAWGQQQNPNQIANSFLAQEAQSQINTQLQSKGLQMVQESENPDLIVVASGGMKTQTSYNAWGMRGIRSFCLMPAMQLISTSRETRHLTACLLGASIAPAGLGRLPAEKRA